MESDKLHDNRRPIVGIGVFVFNDRGEFPMLKRKGAHGEGTWSLPGGHLEYGESFEEATRREITHEEIGVSVDNICVIGVTSCVLHAEKNQPHYVDIWIACTHRSGEIRNLEPDKCSQIGMFTLNSLPRPWFQTWDQFLENTYLCDRLLEYRDKMLPHLARR